MKINTASDLVERSTHDSVDMCKTASTAMMMMHIIAANDAVLNVNMLFPCILCGLKMNAHIRDINLYLIANPNLWLSIPRRAHA